MLPVPQLTTIHENDHMRADSALVVEDVGAGSWVTLEDGVEHLTHRLAVHLGRWAAHVALNVGSEGDGSHTNKA
jgi:hypothetical protein